MKSKLTFLFSVALVTSNFIANSAPFNAQLIGEMIKAIDPQTGNAYMQDSSAYTYDSNGNLNSKTNFISEDVAPDLFYNTGKQEYFYDQNNKEIEQLSFSWNFDSLRWDSSQVKTTNYDVLGNIATVIYENYGANGWQNYLKNTMTYNANNNLTMDETKTWDTLSSTWVSSSICIKEVKIYDGNNFLISHETYRWDVPTTSYKGVTKINYTNNGQGFPTYTMNQIWNGVNAWYDMDCDSTIYNGSNVPLEIYHRYRHQGGMEKWGMQNRTLFTLNANNKVIESNISDWNIVQSAYVLNGNASKQIFSYNSDNKITQIIAQGYDSTAQKFYNAVEFYFHYSEGALKENKVVENGSVIFPNPTSGSFTISSNSILNSIEIMNASGQLVYVSTTLNSSNCVIDLSNFKQGVYFVRIKNQKGTKMEKLMVN